MGTVSGYILPSSYYNIINNNTILFNLPALSGVGNLDVVVTNPGGRAAVGGFEKTFDLFFSKYFSQAFMKSSGIKDYLENPLVYKANIKAGKNNGKSVGIRTGYQWIAQAGVA